jgi:hypothetical protein
MSNIYPERDMFGCARYCRLVRNESKYWVESIFVADGDDEDVLVFTTALTPSAAVIYAQEVIADMRRQIEQSEYYRDDGDGGIERFTFNGYDGTVYLKILHPGNADSLYMTVANLDLWETKEESLLQALCRDAVSELEKHIQELPELSGTRWMLLY